MLTSCFQPQRIRSAIDTSLSRPQQHTTLIAFNEEELQTLIKTLNLQAHPEGGFFRETGRNPRHVPNPFSNASDDPTRSICTTTYCLITPEISMGGFRHTRARTIFFLLSARGRYELVHADEGNIASKKGVETFVTGPKASKEDAVDGRG